MENKVSVKIERSVKDGLINGNSITMSAEGDGPTVIVLAEDFLNRLKDGCLEGEEPSEETEEEAVEEKNEVSITAQETAGAQVGQIIPFQWENRKDIELLVLEIKDDIATCIFYDCLPDEQAYNSECTNEGGYEQSDLRKALNGKILETLPADLREKMVPFENEDYLMPPSEKEIFGVNEYGEPEQEEVKQFGPMKKRRNRIAFIGEDEDLEWYWLRNKRVASSANFCHCSYDGVATYNNASYLYGVRPLCRIRIENL